MKARFNDYEMDITSYITKYKNVNNKNVRIFEVFARLNDLEKHRRFVKILQNDFRFTVEDDDIDLLAKTNLKQYTPCIPNEKSKISYVIHIEEIEKVEDTYGDKLNEPEIEYEIVEEVEVVEEEVVEVEAEIVTEVEIVTETEVEEQAVLEEEQVVEEEVYEVVEDIETPE